MKEQKEVKRIVVEKEKNGGRRVKENVGRDGKGGWRLKRSQENQEGTYNGGFYLQFWIFYGEMIRRTLDAIGELEGNVVIWCLV